MSEGAAGTVGDKGSCSGVVRGPSCSEEAPLASLAAPWDSPQAPCEMATLQKAWKASHVFCGSSASENSSFATGPQQLGQAVPVVAGGVDIAEPEPPEPWLGFADTGFFG